MDKRATQFPSGASDLGRSIAEANQESGAPETTQTIIPEAGQGSAPEADQSSAANIAPGVHENSNLISEAERKRKAGNPFIERRAKLRGQNRLRIVSPLSIRRTDPRLSYRPVLEENQGGRCLLCYTNDRNFSLFVLRQSTNVPFEEKYSSDLQFVNHDNIVALREYFVWDGGLYFVYATMSVPLIAIQCTSDEKFHPYEVAAICKEVLKGLLFIHSTLEISYGTLDENNILLDSRANIKLANIGESMLLQHHSQQNDLSMLGVLTLRLLNIVCKDVESLQAHVVDVNDRYHQAVSFAKSTVTSDGSQLLKNDFLKLSPGSACLVPRVCVAERSWFRGWHPHVSEES